MKKEIIEYFNSKQLKVLDVNPGGYNKSFYTGVTVGYIAKYVCHTTPGRIVRLLWKMHQNGELRALFCGTVNEPVFESATFPTNHWNYEKGNWGADINDLKKHLESFVKTKL